jgi:hypothetical protein
MRRLGFARGGALFLLLASLAGAQPARAASFDIQGNVRQGYGWSGWWWPMLDGQGAHLYDTQGAYTPLVKYGQLTGDNGPLEWERTYGYTTDSKKDWWGHCNGWAAASILEPEPTRAGEVWLPGGPKVRFNVGEIKGLLTLCHYADGYDWGSGVAHVYGTDWSTDLRADAFHNALLYYLRDRGEGVVFNITSKPEIWNFPCFAFRMRAETDPNRPEVTRVTTTIWYASDDVGPNDVGRKVLWKTYTYEVRGDFETPKGADWTGPSLTDHPQFVWHPLHLSADDPNGGQQNPISYKIVRQIAQLSAGAAQ